MSRGGEHESHGQRAEKCPQNAPFHDCKDFIKVTRSGLAPRAEASATLGSGSPAHEASSCRNRRLFRRACSGGGGAERRRPRPVRCDAASSPQAPNAFDLVGLHWRGIRSRPLPDAARRRGLEQVAPLGAGGRRSPGPQHCEAKRSRGWHLGNPFWVGRSERIQYRVGSRVTRLRAFFVRTPLLGGTPQHVQPFAANAPTIITRAQWGANEAIRRNLKKAQDRGQRAPRDRPPHGRHEQLLALRSRPRSSAGSSSTTCGETAGTTSATTSSSTSTARSSRADTAGWRRRSSAPTRWASTSALSAWRCSVTTTARALTAAERASLVQLLAWRLDLAHLDPLSNVTRRLGGKSASTARGLPVVAARDLRPPRHGPHDCPGNASTPSFLRSRRSALRPGCRRSTRRS